MAPEQDSAAIASACVQIPHFAERFRASHGMGSGVECDRADTQGVGDRWAVGRVAPSLMRSAAPNTWQGDYTGSVLLVEDDSGSCSVLENMLVAAGHRVTTARNSSSARHLVSCNEFDLIVLDVFLPDMDGIELTRWLRARGGGALPVILVTGRDDTRIMARGLEAGADDFLIKPVNAMELRARIRSLLRSKVLSDKLQGCEQAAVAFAAPAPPDPLGSAAQADSVAVPAARPATEAHAATVLVIENQPPYRELLRAFLTDIDCRIVESCDVSLSLLEQTDPDLVILDLTDCRAESLDFLREAKADARFGHIPILAVSGSADVRNRVTALEHGADDFTIKVLDGAELKARARRLIDGKHRLDSLKDRCDRALRKAMTDSLTGLFTHGFIAEMLQREVSCARRHGERFSVVFIDIDQFKSVNDRHGHSTGDRVLKEVARAIRGALRGSDVVARHGGDEFVALLPHTDYAGALRLAERIRGAIEALAIAPVAAAEWDFVRVTASIGIANFPNHAADAKSLLQHADEAMYTAKQLGRNKVMPFGPHDAPDPEHPRVLVVDDDEAELERLDGYLAPQGYKILKARDGQEALELVRRVQPDLIVLDGVMPHVDGFDVCRRLKQESGTCLIPVVMVTRLEKREDRLRAFEAGSDDFLTKPVNEAQLLARARALLRSKRATDLLENAETVIFTLARAVEGRDPSTGGHVERVSRYAVELGRALGLPAPQIEGLRRAGYVHDIGKIAVPDAVLLKPGKLTPGERKIMERHVETGYELLRPLRTFSESLPAVRFHHERLDGSGYPLGLRGDQVPLIAQIMAVVDVYDALTTDRSYRAAMSHAEAIRILREEAARGMHDPKLVETFVSLVRAN